MCASTSCARAVPLKKRRRKNKSAARAVIQPRHDPVGQVRQIRQRQEYFNDARLDEDKHESFIHLLTRPQRECICKQLSFPLSLPAETNTFLFFAEFKTSAAAVAAFLFFFKSLISASIQRSALTKGCSF